MSKAVAALKKLLDRVRPAEEATERMRQKLIGTDRREFEKNADQVGEMYFDAAMRNPNFFMFGPRFEDDLAAQFGVGEKFGLLGPDSTPFDADYLGTHGRYASPGKDPSSFSRTASFDKWPEMRIIEMDRRAPLMALQEPMRGRGLRPTPYILDEVRKQGHSLAGSDKLRKFETGDVPAGTNAGARLYGAEFGDLARSPNTVNYSSALTGNNSVRRSFNMAPAIMRDPTLSEKILVHPDQLEIAGAPLGLTAGDLNRMGAKRLVGALQMLGTQGTLNRAMRSTKAASESGARYFAQPEKVISHGDDPMFIDRFTRGGDMLEAILGLERSGGWDDESIVNFARAARAQRKELDAAAPTIGEKTARKMGLTMRTRTGGDPSSIDTNELEFRHGGYVGAKDLRGKLQRRRVKAK